MDISRRRSAFRALVQDFGPFWFTWCMNSGILGLLTHQLPYQFHGLKIISTVFYVLDLVLFIFFSTIMTLRIVIYRSAAYEEIVDDEAELMLCGCWPIAFMTLTSLTSLISSNAYWGHSFAMVSYVMWWVVAAWSLAFLLWIFTTLIRKHHATDRRLSMLVILPAVSVSTAAVTGAFVVSMSHGLSPRLGAPVIIVSFMLVGLGILLGFMLCTYLFHGLLAKGWPAPQQTASLFIFIGPFCQSAAGLQQLGIAANKDMIFAQYDRGSFITARSAESLEATCTLIALLLTGLGIVWALLAVFAMSERAMQKELKWAPGWNSIIFPMGTMCTSFELFATQLDSVIFRVVTTILVVILILVFLLNTVFTVLKIGSGKLLIIKDDPRSRDGVKRS